MRILLEATPVAYSVYRGTLAALTEFHNTEAVKADFTPNLKAVQKIIQYPHGGELAQRYAT
jgi:hypothetical protein